MPDVLLFMRIIGRGGIFFQSGSPGGLYGYGNGAGCRCLIDGCLPRTFGTGWTGGFWLCVCDWTNIRLPIVDDTVCGPFPLGFATTIPSHITNKNNISTDVHLCVDSRKTVSFIGHTQTLIIKLTSSRHHAMIMPVWNCLNTRQNHSFVCGYCVFSKWLLITRKLRFCHVFISMCRNKLILTYLPR